MFHGNNQVGVTIAPRVLPDQLLLVREVVPPIPGPEGLTGPHFDGRLHLRGVIFAGSSLRMWLDLAGRPLPASLVFMSERGGCGCTHLTLCPRDIWKRGCSYRIASWSVLRMSRCCYPPAVKSYHISVSAGPA